MLCVYDSTLREALLERHKDAERRATASLPTAGLALIRAPSKPSPERAVRGDSAPLVVAVAVTGRTAWLPSHPAYTLVYSPVCSAAVTQPPELREGSTWGSGEGGRAELLGRRNPRPLLLPPPAAVGWAGEGERREWTCVWWGAGVDREGREARQRIAESESVGLGQRGKCVVLRLHSSPSTEFPGEHVVSSCTHRPTLPLDYCWGTHLYLF